MDENGDFVAAYSDLVQTPVEIEALAELTIMRFDAGFWVERHDELRKLLTTVRESPDGLAGLDRRTEAALERVWSSLGTPLMEPLVTRLPTMPLIVKLAYWNVYCRIDDASEQPEP